MKRLVKHVLVAIFGLVGLALGSIVAVYLVRGLIQLLTI